MKKTSLLLGLIFSLLGFSVQAQIVTEYELGFENSSEVYTVTGNAQTVSNVYSSGSHCLKLPQSSSEVTFTTDVIDCTDNGSYHYFFLEFMHINNVNPMSTAQAQNVGVIEYRIVDASGNGTWMTLQSTDYDMTWGGGSNDYSQVFSFSWQSYGVWQSTSVSNTMWKKERFNLTSHLDGIALLERKIQFRFRLYPQTSGTSYGAAWYIDGLSFKVSPQSMALPIIKMGTYPDLVNYPNSRGARVSATITTTATQGMNPDSVYLEYMLGHTDVRRTPTTARGNNTYEAHLPFCGYDTIVSWRLIAKDATNNHNMASFPIDASSWNQYKYVRGTTNSTFLATSGLSNNNSFPFPGDGSARSQFVYDSATLASMGYKAGAITGLQYQAATSVSNSAHNRFQIVMKNVDPSFAVGTGSSVKFYLDEGIVVYDSSLNITQNANTSGTINFQDTFFYAGKDILVLVSNYNSTSDPAALSVKCFPAPTDKGSVSKSFTSALGFNPFTDALFNTGTATNTRPNFNFKAWANMPLVYDCGVSGFITPNDSVTGDASGTGNNVVLTLKNYGASTINAVRLYYSVDNGIAQYYDWTGSLAPNATTNVTVNTTQQYTPGYHEMLAWVDDSVTVNGVRFRDHEPLNDTCWTRFVGCNGPMSGQRIVGGSTPDYPDLEKCLYAISLCGVNGPLTVKLASGYYMPHVFPTIPGSSSENYVQVEPLSGLVEFCAPAGASTTVAQYLVNLQNTQHVRFKGINFRSVTNSGTSNNVTYLVRMGINSSDCQFINCSFREEIGTSTMDNTFTSALIYSGGADSVLVDGCTFYRGTVGVSMVGPASDNLAVGNRIVGSNFTMQKSSSVVVRNQMAAVVDSNTMNDVTTNSSYLILLQDCYGATRVTRNKVYATTGASCIGATDLHGTSTDYAIVANNMLVSADEGSSNMLVTPLNIITADYAKVVFNSVKLTAPTRAGIAAATLGGGVINQCHFYNNIVSCFDTANFAFNYIPNTGNINYIGYNIYYSQGAVLNKFNSINCTSLPSWQNHYSDPNSQAVSPAFLGADAMDLRSYSQNVKAHGVPIAEVTDDLFGTVRNTETPCVGAFEFSALPYDFEITEMLEPYNEYCDVPAYAPLKVVIKNTGVNTFDPATSSLTFSYNRNAAPGTFSPTNSGNVTVNRTIPGNDTIHFNTNQMVEFLPNGTLDTSYRFSMWLTTTIDPNPANDTSQFTVLSHYHYPAIDSLNTSVNYGTTATLTPTGHQTWYSNVYTSGRTHKSTTYWYNDPSDDEPFYIGNTYTTGTLYTDTLFYIRQRRDFPLVKISEVQIKATNVQGVTYPMPLWMNAQTAFAVELTNIGDVPAQMEGDTLLVISNTSGLNNKVYEFPNVTIQPGECLVLQYRAGINNVDSTKTLGTATVSPAYNSHFAVLYKDGNGIVDGVAFNDFVTGTGNIPTNWNAANVPNTVWTGAGIPLTQTTAGVYRKSWPTNPNGTPSNSANYWQVADSVHNMTLGTVNRDLIRFTDNGCPGDYTTARVQLINLPDVDLCVDSLNLQSGCGLALEPVDLTIHNRGAFNSGTFNAYLSLNDTIVCVDTLAGLGMNGVVTHTFSQPINLLVASGTRNYDVKAWVSHVEADNSAFNDTTALSIYSSYTPVAPVIPDTVVVDYANSAILQTLNPTQDSLLWYDNNMNALDTVNVFVTEPIFLSTTFYATAFGTVSNPIHIGTFANSNSNSGYPSPYNPNKKYVKEQYLYTADDLRAAGHTAGPIEALSFHLDTILAPAGTMTFTDYKVSVGFTSQTTFTANNNWLTVSEVYNAPSLTITNDDRGWIKHPFTAPVVWDGNSSIVVEICRSIATAITQGAKVHYTAGGSNTTLSKNDNNTATIATFTGNGSRSANRPDILFDFVDYGCEGPSNPVHVVVEGTPNLDASLSWPEGYDTLSVSSCGATDLNVVLHNGGNGTLHDYSIDCWIDGTHSTYQGTDSVVAQGDVVLTIASPSFTPGRHHISMAVTALSDTVQINDTISCTKSISFCAGTYTIGASASNTFHSFTEALDTLNNAGIAGAIVFAVEDGTYNEQLVFGPIAGSSAMNTITFQSASGNRENVILNGSPVATANYVLSLDGVSNIAFNNMTIYATGANAASNAVVMNNASTIHFQNTVIRVKGTINNQNANCVVYTDNVKYVYFDSCMLDSGYYSIKAVVPNLGTSEGLSVSDCQIQNFWYQGIVARKLNDVYIRRNNVYSGVNVNSRALTGIMVAEHQGGTEIIQNNVVLNDNKNGGKRGIHLVNCAGSNALRSKVYNNMVAINGNGVNGLVPGGIWVDSCDYMNVYYNSVRLYASANAPTSRAFTTESNTSSVYMLNNIFSNFSNGYAIYVKNPINVTTSNYNAYYSSADNKLAFWGVDGLYTFDTLKMTNHQDVNSNNLQPYFVSETDLHLSFGVYSEMAQYNTEVPNDIDNEIRPQIPSPCIGADQPEAHIHDLCVTDVVEPTLDPTKTYLSTLIEGDTLSIVVRLYNDGSSVESNSRWKADIFSYPDSVPYTSYGNLTTGYQTIDEHPAHQAVYDTSFIVLPIGVYDTNWIRIIYQMTGSNAVDAVPHNDTIWAKFYIDPAYNLVATSTTVDFGTGCRLQNTPISITVTNVGRKPIPSNLSLSIGYEAVLNTSGVTIAQLPLTHVEPNSSLGELDVNASAVLNFVTPANLYPTNTAKDIQVRVRTWCTLEYDHRPANDTSNFVNVTSKYTPSAPQGPDLHIPYATWDTIFATQTDNPPTGAAIHRPIRWHRDSLADPYFENSNYARSCWWETPQYFHDSTYYLSCISTSGCTSYYSPVSVILNPRVSVDAAVERVEQPYSKVFMNNDTVKVRLINYGNQPLTNIPVVYQLFSPSNQLLQQVREVCSATIQPNETYLFKFDSLVITPQENATYHLRCWTDMSNEQVRLNDTIRHIYDFVTLPESTYADPLLMNVTGIDITRVAFASLDNSVPEVGNNYIDFGSFNNPDVEALHMIKGTTDTFYISTANSDDHADNNTGVFLTTFIDYNRDGIFQPHEIIFADTAVCNHTKKFVYTYPTDAYIHEIMEDTSYPICLGYMKMRVCAATNGHEACNGIPDFEFGQVQDYLLYIEDRPANINASASRIVSPRSNFVTEDSTTVVFMMSNKGAQPITSANIAYAFIDDSCTAQTSQGTMDWNGTLLPGQSVAVALPARHLITGTTNVKICVNVPGDTIQADDTLRYQYHRFKVITLILNDDFEHADIFYAPRGYNEYSKNVWERGITHKPNLVAAHSDSTVWATNLAGLVNHGGRGNLSYLYTPIIDISQIRPDTIDFWLATDMAEDSYVNLEFYDYLGRWQIVGSANDTLWYNDPSGFSGATSGYSYEHFRFSTNQISGDFQQRLQFRLVYRSKPSCVASDGAILDDFRIGRARRAVDVGVIQITHPTNPKFGQTIYPKVVIKNYGYEPVYSVNLAYRPYGSNLPLVGTWTSAEGLAPGENTLYTFEDPFIVMNDFPDTFQICAYTTVNTDIYWENDSLCKDFYLSPLENDMGMCEFVYPLDHIVAGDSIAVTTRIRNFGMDSVESTIVTYNYNNYYQVTDTIHFPTVLGHPLGSFEYFNYTFKEKCRASMGIMHLTAYTQMPEDDYLYNDTITKTINGISEIVDLKANSIVVDRSGMNGTRIQLQIDNIGARAANDFEVAFWIDNDTSTLIRQTYHTALPLAALHSAYFVFDTILPQRQQGYDYVVGYVHVDGDNDLSNDTTAVITDQFIDLRARRLLIEENREETCRVRMELENLGNLTYNARLSMQATINGVTIHNSGPSATMEEIVPGQIYTIDFAESIPKNHSRVYEGSGELISPSQDRNPANDQTSETFVMNYFGIPYAEAATGVSLDQNNPNPFVDETRITFHLPNAGMVRFFVMDELGRLVYQNESEYAEGDNTVRFKDSKLTSGVYYYGIEFNGQRLMRKMVYKN